MFLFVDIVLVIQEIDGGYSHIYIIYTHICIYFCTTYTSGMKAEKNSQCIP